MVGSASLESLGWLKNDNLKQQPLLRVLKTLRVEFKKGNMIIFSHVYYFFY